MANVTKRINQNGNISYRIRVCRGVNADGSPHVWSTTWRPDSGLTERQADKEAQRQAFLFEEQIEDELRHGLSGKKVKFKDLANEWLDLMEATGEMKTSSILRMRSCTGRTFSALGNYEVDTINYRQIQQFILSLSKPGVNQRTGQGLAAKTQKHYISLISDVMKYAKKCGYIKDNPCRDIASTKTVRHEPSAYSIEEEVALLEAMQRRDAPLKYQVFFRFMIYCGMRRGEVLGLEWKDIDLTTGLCSIRRTSAYQNSDTGTYTTTPKTESSYRTIKLPDELIAMLRRYKLEQNTYSVLYGAAWVGTDRLFTALNGSPMHPGRPYNWLLKFCNREGLPFKGIHSFRHAFASEMICSGQVDVRTVSAILGHSQTSTTLNIYAHAVQQASAHAMDVMTDLISQKKKNA